MPISARCAGLLACLVAAAAAAPARVVLDRARIHVLYRDGEFEKVIGALAPYGRGACACSRDDSLFAEKHLAVVLAANPATRELGRYHMHRLLDLSARADLLDMYVGDEVDAIFDKVRKEHALRVREAAPRARPDKSPRPAAAAPAPPSAGGGDYSEAWAGAPGPEDGQNESSSASAPGAGSMPAAEAAFQGPSWKQPGIWIGGGAVIAMVAFTLWQAGSGNPGQGKVFDVPATPSK